MDKLTDSGFLGAYRYAGITGVIGAAIAANSEIFQFRWTDTTRLGEVRRVLIAASVSTTMFAAGVPVAIDMVKASAWTVAGTGGTGETPAALFKKRTLMPVTLMATGDIRIATTAALGAGTKTLEGGSIGAHLAGGPITAGLNGTIFPQTRLFEVNISEGDYPLILGANEGFVIRAVAVPATGTWKAAIIVDWNERTTY